MYVADPNDKRVPAMARACLMAFGVQLRRLKEQILEFDRMIRAWQRSSEMSMRLDDYPGVGPALATALSLRLPTQRPSDQGAISGLDRARAEAAFDRGQGNPYWENEYWCAVRRRVGFRSLSVPRANLPKVGRPCAVEMPRYQRLTDSVLNQRSPELWRSEAAENEFRFRLRRFSRSVFYAKARRYWASLLTRKPAENVGLGRPGGGSATGIQKPLNL